MFLIFFSIFEILFPLFPLVDSSLLTHLIRITRTHTRTNSSQVLFDALPGHNGAPCFPRLQRAPGIGEAATRSGPGFAREVVHRRQAASSASTATAAAAGNGSPSPRRGGGGGGGSSSQARRIVMSVEGNATVRLLLLSLFFSSSRIHLEFISPLLLSFGLFLVCLSLLTLAPVLSLSLSLSHTHTQ